MDPSGLPIFQLIADGLLLSRKVGAPPEITQQILVLYREPAARCILPFCETAGPLHVIVRRHPFDISRTG
jgi:hypothetical protein